MSCESGGRGFRQLGNLSKDRVDVVCMNCHDRSYTNLLGVGAPEAAVGQNQNPAQGGNEYVDFNPNCRDCDTNHSPLLAGDGITSTIAISSPPQDQIDETHDVEHHGNEFLARRARGHRR